MRPVTTEHRCRADGAAASPPSAIASVIDPKTSANRKPTTRPISSGGVRCWKRTWLGITKTMFAMPAPSSSPKSSDQAAAQREEHDQPQPNRT